MENVRNYIRGGKMKLPPFDICASNVLMMGISTTHKNVTYKSDYGVVGDYCIARIYEKHNRSSTLPFSDEEPFDKMLAEAPIHEKSFDRFHILLNDLLSLKSSSFASLDFAYLYYDEIKVLNIEVSARNIKYNMFESKPFTSFYVKDIGEDIMNNVAQKLSEENIHPNLILFSVNVEPNIRIHPYSFTYLVECIELAQKDGELHKMPPSFPLYLYRVFFTAPKIDLSKQTIPFQIGKNNESYQLIAITIRLNLEVIIYTNDFSDAYDDTPELQDCFESFIEKSIEAVD